jgi:hypothetical protein
MYMWGVYSSSTTRCNDDTSDDRHGHHSEAALSSFTFGKIVMKKFDKEDPWDDVRSESSEPSTLTRPVLLVLSRKARGRDSRPAFTGNSAPANGTTGIEKLVIT